MRVVSIDFLLKTARKPSYGLGTFNDLYGQKQDTSQGMQLMEKCRKKVKKRKKLRRKHN